MHCVAAECRDVLLSGPIEPFEQLNENGIGTGEIEHLFGRGDYVSANAACTSASLIVPFRARSVRTAPS